MGATESDTPWEVGLIYKYMVANKLIINYDKTHLVVMGKQGHGGQRDRVVLQAGVHSIHPVKSEKLLGCNTGLQKRAELPYTRHSHLKPS